MTHTNSIEAALISVIEGLRHECDVSLAQRGLCMQSPTLSVLSPETNSYSSELRIDITQRETGQLVDRLEFFAFENGKAQVTGEELRIWLIEQIENLLKEHT